MRRKWPHELHKTIGLRSLPSRFDPLLAMSYHDLTQEAHRLRRANRRSEKGNPPRSVEESDSGEFVLSNPAPRPKPWRGANRRTLGRRCCYPAWTASRAKWTCLRRMVRLALSSRYFGRLGHVVDPHTLRMVRGWGDAFPPVAIWYNGSRRGGQPGVMLSVAVQRPNRDRPSM